MFPLLHGLQLTNRGSQGTQNPAHIRRVITCGFLCWLKKPTAFLGCVVQSFLRCRDLFVMFDCSSYCLRGLAPSQRLRNNCCFAHRGFDTLCLTDIQSVGTVPFLSLSLSLSLSLCLSVIFTFARFSILLRLSVEIQTLLQTRESHSA